jgi:hypothetical protein
MVKRGVPPRATKIRRLAEMQAFFIFSAARSSYGIIAA